jgi:hypothetical protein
MPGGRHKQSRKREQAIANLLASATIEQAAQKTGISEKTLRLWLAEPDFSRAYRKARAQVVEHAVTLLQRVTSLAVGTLHRAMSCGKPATEVAAAGKILEHALRAVQLFDLAQQLDELKQQMQEVLQHNGNGHLNPRGRAAEADTTGIVPLPDAGAGPSASGSGPRPA